MEINETEQIQNYTNHKSSNFQTILWHFQWIFAVSVEIHKLHETGMVGNAVSEKTEFKPEIMSHLNQFLFGKKSCITFKQFKITRSKYFRFHITRNVSQRPRHLPTMEKFEQYRNIRSPEFQGPHISQFRHVRQTNSFLLKTNSFF